MAQKLTCFGCDHTPVGLPATQKQAPILSAKRNLLIIGPFSFVYVDLCNICSQLGELDPSFRNWLRDRVLEENRKGAA